MIPKDSPKIFRRKLLFFAFLFINLLLHFISILHYSKEHLGVTHKLDKETVGGCVESRGKKTRGIQADDPTTSCADKSRVQP